jgi:hypothetical protein
VTEIDSSPTLAFCLLFICIIHPQNKVNINQLRRFSSSTKPTLPRRCPTLGTELRTAELGYYIISLKNSNDAIENRTRYIPFCSVMPQPNPPPLQFSLSSVLIDIYILPLDSSATYTNSASNSTSCWNVWRSVPCFSVCWKVAIDCSCS